MIYLLNLLILAVITYRIFIGIQEGLFNEFVNLVNFLFSASMSFIIFRSLQPNVYKYILPDERYAFLISFWVLISPTYCLFYSLEEMDVFRSPHWENSVQEDLLTDLGKKWFGFGWIICALVLCQGRERFNISSTLFITSLPIQKTSILRC